MVIHKNTLKNGCLKNEYVAWLWLHVYKLSFVDVGNSKPTGRPASTDGRTGAAETGNSSQVFPGGGGPSTANAGTTARGLDPDQRTVQHLPQVRQPGWCWVWCTIHCSFLDSS